MKIHSRNSTDTNSSYKMIDSLDKNSEIILYKNMRDVNDKNQTPTAINKSNFKELTKKIEALLNLTKSQNEEINKLKNEVNSEKLKNQNMAIEIEKMKNRSQVSQTLCKCKLNHETQTKRIKNTNTDSQIIDSKFENTSINLKTTSILRSTKSHKKLNHKTNSRIESHEVQKLDESHGHIEQENKPPIPKNKSVLKLLRSSSVIITSYQKNTIKENLSKKSRKRMNFSQDIIINDYKKRETDSDVLIDDEMEKLIKKLRGSRGNNDEANVENRKKFHTLNKFKSFNNISTKEEKRKKIMEDFKSNCKENKKVLKTIANNTESKLKNYLHKQNDKKETAIKEVKSRCLNSVDYKAKLDTDSEIINAGTNMILENGTLSSNNILRYNTKDKILTSLKKDFAKNQLNLENKTLPGLTYDRKTILKKLKL